MCGGKGASPKDGDGPVTPALPPPPPRSSAMAYLGLVRGLNLARRLLLASPVVVGCVETKTTTVCRRLPDAGTPGGLCRVWVDVRIHSAGSGVDWRVQSADRGPSFQALADVGLLSSAMEPVTPSYVSRRRAVLRAESVARMQQIVVHTASMSTPPGPTDPTIVFLVVDLPVCRIVWAPGDTWS